MENIFLSSDDIAPMGGEYRVLTPSGEIIGHVYVKKGNFLPPLQSPINHFEKVADNSKNT